MSTTLKYSPHSLIVELFTWKSMSYFSYKINYHCSHTLEREIWVFITRDTIYQPVICYLKDIDNHIVQTLPILYYIIQTGCSILSNSLVLYDIYPLLRFQHTQVNYDDPNFCLWHLLAYIKILNPTRTYEKQSTRQGEDFDMTHIWPN